MTGRKWTARGLRAALGCVVLGCAGGAAAETLKISGTYPAGSREAAALTRMAVARFDGSDGPMLAREVERRLGEAQIDGARWFTLISASPRLGGGVDQADGVVSGVVASGVESFPFRQERERCAERKDGKCLKEEKYQARCTRRVVNFEADMRVTRTQDGAIVWSRAIPKREERSWCEGDAMPATAEETIRGMIDAVAGETRVALAPRTESYEVRIREGRSGMAKDVSQRFRGAVLATDRDPAAACAEFARLDGEAAAHVSIAFNVALCAEWQGDYAQALKLYERAGSLERRGASDIEEGIGRVEAMLAFEEDMAAMAPTAG